MRFLLAIPMLLASVTAQAAARPVVLQLFTSQSCSSCPPADRLMAEFAKNRPDVLPLDFHVDYWNYLSWHDPFSSRAATDRQQFYANALGADVYTPQIVVDGRVAAVGSDRAAIETAIDGARAAAAASPGVSVAPSADRGKLHVEIGDGNGAARVLLVGFDSEHTTEIGSGENGGRTLTEANVVRAWRDIGGWNGHKLSLDTAPPEGGRVALLLQDKTGRILGASVAPAK